MSDPRLVYMTDEAYRAAVCIHEAIHADYMESIGDCSEYVRSVLRKLNYDDGAVHSRPALSISSSPLGDTSSRYNWVTSKLLWPSHD